MILASVRTMMAQVFKPIIQRFQPQPPPIPDILGLHLGGHIEFNPLRLRLVVPELTVDSVAPTQVIEAIGRVILDDNTQVWRYYTDDEGYLEVLLEGGLTEEHIRDVKLWYFYQTEGVHSEDDWQQLIHQRISQPTFELSQKTFSRLWQAAGEVSPPLAMTETTWVKGASAELATSTDQFMMRYERSQDDLFEFLNVVAEEKWHQQQCERCLVYSTGFDLRVSDFSVG